VNTTAIPRELLESELFGHERGAFTGALASRIGRFSEASGGTLFLDEIGDMPADLQAKLLRVLQDQIVTPVGAQRAEKVDVRILAATHRDLDALVSDGSFREDLLYRLRVMPIHLPALRERSEDIEVLAEYFITCYADDLAGGARFLADSAAAFLSRCPWPGNVRELENAIKRALVLSTGEVLTQEDFAFLESKPAEPDAADLLRRLIERDVQNALENRETGEIYRAWLERVERPLLETVLSHTDGNQIRAAALLGINRNTLRKKITDLGIVIPGRQ
jgi:two-component system nitrogen regulation response regulator GlnG